MMGFFWPNKLEKNNKALINKIITAGFSVAAISVLASCGSPPRLDQDIDIEKTKSLVENRVLAPLSRDNESAAELPEYIPRRQLLQLRYNDDSLINPDFIDTLERLSAVYSGNIQDDEVSLPSSLTATAVSFTPEEDPFQSMKDNLEEDVPLKPVYEPIAAEERQRIISIRNDKRSDIIIREGLRLEQDLFGKLRTLDESFATAGQTLETTLFTQLNAVEDQIKTYEDNKIPGVGTIPPDRVFGRDLTRDRDGYFAIPPELALMGSANDGAVSSKIGALRGYVENPVVQISFNNLSLADAIRFVSATANLQVLMSNEVEDSEQRVTLNVEAGVLSIIDALLNQYEISILYDQDLEVAQFYTDTEFQTRLARVRQAVEGYNTNLYETRETAKLKQQRDLLNELIAVARAIIYDYETEQAASYSTSDVDRLITSIPQNDDLFSKPLSEKRALEALQRDKERLVSMISLVQSLLSGDAEAFINEIDLLDRSPGSEVISTTLNELTLTRLNLAETLEKYDAETDRALADRLVEPVVVAQKKQPKKKLKKRGSIRSVPGFANLAVADPCVYEGREVYTEKIAVYGGENAVTRIQNILDGYFSANANSFSVSEDEESEETESDQPAGDDTAAETEEPQEDAAQNEGQDEGAEGTSESSLANVDVSAGDLIPDAPKPVATTTDDEDKRPAGCGEDPAAESPNFVAASDNSGFVVTGLISDIELFVRLVEEFDRPQRQVLVEVFMINVVKDFSRKLDLSFQTDALAGNLEDTDGFFLRRDLTALSNNVTSTNPGGFVSGLISPNLQIQALVDFIETNDLGRTISSPTILVEEGSSAYVTRKNTKPVTRITQQTVLDSNNNSVSVPSSTTETEEVSFRLDVGNVAINPNNNNVSLEFTLKDQSFETTLANVDANTGKIEDEIKTNFVAAPGDVIVLAGLFKQSDSAEATGLPGTTTTGLPTAFLLGGEDSVGNKVEEMIILMAPTVIEPEIGKQSPNSALSRTLGTRPVQLNEGE